MTTIGEISSFFQCFKTPFEVFLCVTCQTGITYATTEAILDDKNASLWDYIFGNPACCGVACAAYYFQRQKIKAKYNLEGTDEKSRMIDVLLSGCLAPCTACQNYHVVSEKAGKSQPSFAGKMN